MAELNIQRNARVLASDGEVGRVSHVIVDPQTKEVTHLVVGRDGADYEVPMTAVRSVDGDRVTLQGDRSAVGRRFDREQYHEVDEDEVRSDTIRTAQRGGAPLQDADEDEVQVGSTRQPRTAVEDLRQSDATRPSRLQLREERLRVGTVQEEAGAVELGKRVVERTETAEVPLREERVVIERRPVAERVAGGEIADTDETLEVDLMRERAVVDKEAVVTEEVGVRKEATERTEQVQGTVRKEELVAEEHGDVDVAGDANRARGGAYEAERTRRD